MSFLNHYKTCSKNSKFYYLWNIQDFDLFSFISKMPTILTLHMWILFLIFQWEYQHFIFKFQRDARKITSVTPKKELRNVLSSIYINLSFMKKVHASSFNIIFININFIIIHGWNSFFIHNVYSTRSMVNGL
jgi:hypothetical protein